MKRNLSSPTPPPREPAASEMSERELRKRAEDILKQQRIVTLSVQDSEGPWAVPVFYAQDGLSLYFVSNPNSRHGRSVGGPHGCAAAVFNANSEWRKIQGLQMSGVLEALDEERARHALKVYTRKFPFTGAFFNQQQILPEPLRAKVSDVRFYTFRPDRVILVDNTVHFGFHHSLILNDSGKRPSEEKAEDD